MATTIVWKLPTHPQSRAVPVQRKHNTNKSRQRPQRFCGIYPRTHKVTLHHRPKHNNNKQKPATAATIVRNLPTHPQVMLHHRPKPNTTTQTKAGNGCNDCAEFIHIAAPSPQTQQHKQKPATATTIVRNLPTHPVALHGRPKPKPKPKQKTIQQQPH